MNGSIKEFIAESEEIIQQIEANLLQLQENLDTEIPPDLLNALFRAFHTLKGNSSLFGQNNLKDLTHNLEELLDDLRMGRRPVDEEVVEFLFHKTDSLKKALKRLEEGGEIDVTREIQEVEDFRKRAPSTGKEESLEGKIDSEILKVLSEYEEHRLKENIKNNKGIYTIDVVFPLDGFDRRLLEVSEKVKAMGELISTLPTTQNVPEGHIGFKLLFASDRSPEQLGETIGRPPTEVFRPTPPQPSQVPLDSIKSTTSTLRVDIDKIDRILDIVGEVYLSRSMFRSLEQQLRQIYGYADIVFQTHMANQMLERTLAELQQSILDIRMVPIGQVFTRVAQVVRRYARQMQKKVNLQVYGEDTELDKFVAEEVADPLMHIIRNSIDHGIEPPDERKRAGKKEEGNIALRAYQKGNHVVIEVEDDGRGINKRKVLEKAIAQGLVQENQQLSDSEVLDLIFLPGLSTKDSASEVSGRGVGMDVVKEKVASLGGYVEVQSEEGSFTRFSLTLPITLAIIKTLMVRTGGRKFAIPLTSVAESLELEEELVNSVEGRQVYNLRGRPVPLVSLRRYYGLADTGNREAFVVITGVENRQVGLLVEELVGAEDIVIKPLGPYFEGCRGFAGAAEIESGNLILVIDTESIITENLIRTTEHA